MKKILFVILSSFALLNSYSQSINGAWKRDLDTAVQYITIIDDYFSTATFNLADKKFINTRGGTAVMTNNKMSGVIEFNTAHQIGSEIFLFL
jgi:hypothetical protein